MSKHYSNTLVIICSDDRYHNDRDFDRAFKDYLKQISAEDHFLIAVFGSSLTFVIEELKDFRSYVIRMSKMIGIKRVIILDHMICAAYFGTYGDLNTDQEKTKHLDNLKIAKEFFNKEMPQAITETHFQDEDNTFSQI